MPELELAAGVIEYEDTGGDGQVVVFLHGVVISGSLWRNVVPHLRSAYRCIVPTLHLGAHRRPMRPDADLTLRGQVRIVAEFLDRLDLRDITLVGNDWGGAQILISEGLNQRIGRLILCSCEAFDNYPPGLPGRGLKLAAALQGGIGGLSQLVRIRALRRLPLAFGWMSKRPVPDEVVDDWFRPLLTEPRIRRDLRKYSLSLPKARVLLDWAERQRSFGGPVLVVWAAEDRIMPREHGRRLADMFAQGRLLEIPDSYTLLREDQPLLLAEAISDFLDSSRSIGHGHRSPETLA